MMSIELKGVDDVKKLLEEIAPRRATNLITATIRGVATEIQKETKLNVPKRTGNLKKSIKVKRSRSDRYRPVFKVVFESGGKAKYDGFYWRFLEHGTSTGLTANNFVRRSRTKIESNLDFYLIRQFSKKYESAIKREQKRLRSIRR